jgi:sRNA-binding carbon storage regulator CsrA
MLVLSRTLGQSVVIDDQITATIAVIGAKTVDVLLTNADGSRIGIVTLNPQERVQIAPDAHAILLRIEAGRIRLAIDHPTDVRVSRRD